MLVLTAGKEVNCYKCTRYQILEGDKETFRHMCIVLLAFETRLILLLFELLNGLFRIRIISDENLSPKLYCIKDFIF